MAASISGLSSNLAIAQTSGSSDSGAAQGAFRTDFQQLRQALQSGDLSGAQTAFNNLEQLIPAGDQNGPVGTALAKVGQALQAGNLTAAQQGFIPILKGAEKVFHEHHPSAVGVVGGAPSVGSSSGTPDTDGDVGIGSIAQGAASTLAQGAADSLNLLNVIA
jgi:hypothetical protein